MNQYTGRRLSEAGGGRPAHHPDLEDPMTTDPTPDCAHRATFTVTVTSRPDGGHYFDQADFAAHVAQWIRTDLRDHHAVDEVTVIAEAAPSAAVSPPPATDRAALAEDLRYVLGYRGPGHAHDRPGVWDTSGKPCEHCARLAAARENLATYDANPDAVLSVLPPDGRPAVLADTERTMLNYALNQAQLRLWRHGPATEEDQAALNSLRRLAAGERDEQQAQQGGAEKRDDLGGELIDDYLRFLRGQGPEPDLADLAPGDREVIAGRFEIVRALADRDPELPPLDRDPVARRLGLHQPATGVRQQGGPEAHPAEHTWTAELRDPLADEWAPGTRYVVRERAVDALAHARRLAPTWTDGTPTERRLVRATTTYTVEQADAEPCGRPVSLPGPCSAGDHCCNGGAAVPATGQPPADTGEEARPRFVRVCIACPECDHTLDENGACEHGCRKEPS